MTVTLDLSSVNAFLWSAWVWIQAHPYLTAVIWYTPAYFVVRWWNTFSKEEYDIETSKNNIPQIVALVAWLLSPIIIVFIVLAGIAAGLVKVKKTKP